jgi:glycosyltransferase involved in cell wall biosynthesis
MAFMRGVFNALHDASYASVTSISAEPVPRFPVCRRLWISGGPCEISPEKYTCQVPFVNVTPVKQAMIGVGVLLALLRWAWRVRSEPYRAIVCFNLSVPPIILVWLAARITKSRLIAYVCDVSVPGHTVPNSWLHRLDAIVQRAMLARLDGLIAITDKIGELAPHVPQVRVDGALPDDWSANRHVLGCEERFHLVLAGGLSEFNGLPEVLGAFAKLTGPRWRLTIAGRGPLEDRAARAAEIDSRIRYVGFIPQHETRQLYATADALICMRISGTQQTDYCFPSKLFELLASGVPVIATRTGHLVSEYGSLCFLVASPTCSDLADVITNVAALPKSARDAVASRAAAYVLRHKRWRFQGRVITRFVDRIVGLTTQDHIPQP